MKYLVLLFTFISQACLGSLYAWSAFVPELQSNYGISATETQLIFGGLILVNTLTMIPAGRLIKTIGVKPLLATAGLFFTGGYLLAGSSGGNFYLLFLGVAVFLGIGIGCGYVTLLVSCTSWFPKKRGLATGLAVSGFGGGAIFISAVVDWMLLSGFDVLQIFVWLALSGGLIILSSTLIISLPQNFETTASRKLNISLFWQDIRIFGLFIAMLAGTLSGLIIIGNLRPIALASGFPERIALYSIAVFSAGNAGGRLFWGIVDDKIGPRTIPLTLSMLSLSTIGISIFITPVLFYFAVLIAGLSFGASFVIYATQINKLFGTRGLSDVYPVVFVSQGFSGIFGPPLGGVIYDLTGSYQPALLIAIIFPLLATALISQTVLNSSQ